MHISLPCLYIGEITSLNKRPMIRGGGAPYTPYLDPPLPWSLTGWWEQRLAAACWLHSILKMEANGSLVSLLAIRETQKTVCNEGSKFRPGLDRCAGNHVQVNEKQQVWYRVSLGQLRRFFRQRNYSSERAAVPSVTLHSLHDSLLLDTYWIQFVAGRRK
jgi:hypothetical protein